MDPFEEVHSLEEQHIAEGRADGVRDGRAAGLEEGRRLGLQKGVEIGSEVGFYTGCLRMWRHLEKANPGTLPDRAKRTIAAMEQLLASYPLQSPQDEGLHEVLEALRARFKAATSSLGKAGEYLCLPSQQQQQTAALRQGVDLSF